jgi:adenylate cyclase
MGAKVSRLPSRREKGRFLQGDALVAYDAPRRMGLLSRRRYELLALAIALMCAIVHLWSQGQTEVGLTAGEDENVLSRGIHVLEGKAWDVKFRVRGERPAHPDVVVVAVDEKSTQAYGLWPWPRDLMAKAISRLHENQAKAIGLDITFTDKSNAGNDYARLLEDFDALSRAASPEAATQFASFRQQLDKGRSPDDELRDALSAAPEVVQGLIAYGESDVKDFPPDRVKQHIALLQPHLITKAPGKVKGSTVNLIGLPLNSYTFYSAQTPLEIFTGADHRLAHFNFAPDADGVLRRTPIFVNLTGAQGYLPSLALQVAATYFGSPPQVVLRDGLVVGAELTPPGAAPILVPYQGVQPFTLINHVGPASVFKTISIADVIKGEVKREDIAGKAVMIGITTVGESGDQRVTPFKQLEPGIYTHAAMLSNILSRDFLTRPAGLVFVELATMLLFAAVLARFLPRVKLFRTKGLIMVAAIGLYFAMDNGFFLAGYRLSSVLPLASVVLTSFGMVFLGYLSVDQDKQQLRQTFTKYLGAEVMEEALKDPEKLNRGEKREMTVMFSDIRGFTTLSERMLPDKLAAFIKEYLTPMTAIVFDEKGTLDKYIGDALMAFWNAPLDQADHALRACRAAVAMLVKLDQLKAKWREEKYPEFDIGIGINTGLMHVGNMGSDVRSDYTVMGDSVNLASRLEGTNKEYETRIIISEATYNHVKDQVVARRLGAVRVKGKRKPVRIFELRAMGPAAGDGPDGWPRPQGGRDHPAVRGGAGCLHRSEVGRRRQLLHPGRRHVAQRRTYPPVPARDRGAAGQPARPRLGRGLHRYIEVADRKGRPRSGLSRGLLLTQPLRFHGRRGNALPAIREGIPERYDPLQRGRARQGDVRLAGGQGRDLQEGARRREDPGGAWARRILRRNGDHFQQAAQRLGQRRRRRQGPGDRSQDLRGDDPRQLGDLGPDDQEARRAALRSRRADRKPPDVRPVEPGDSPDPPRLPEPRPANGGGHRDRLPRPRAAARDRRGRAGDPVHPRQAGAQWPHRSQRRSADGS